MKKYDDEALVTMNTTGRVVTIADCDLGVRLLMLVLFWAVRCDTHCSSLDSPP